MKAKESDTNELTEFRILLFFLRTFDPLGRIEHVISLPFAVMNAALITEQLWHLLRGYLANSPETPLITDG